MTGKHAQFFPWIPTLLASAILGCIDSPVVLKDDRDSPGDADAENANDKESDAPTMQSISGWWQLVDYHFERQIFEYDLLIETNSEDHDETSHILQVSGDIIRWYSASTDDCFHERALEVGIDKDGVLHAEDEHELTYTEGDDERRFEMETRVALENGMLTITSKETWSSDSGRFEEETSVFVYEAFPGDFPPERWPDEAC